MTDLTQLIEESKQSLDRENLLQVSAWISEELQRPQETIIMLID